MFSNLGTKLRAKRQEMKLTLKQLGEKTGLSVGLISEIERGLAQPSMSSLKKITHAVGLSLYDFVEERSVQEDGQESQTDTGNGRPMEKPVYSKDIKVVRAEHRKKIVYPNHEATYELLTPDLNRLLEVSYVEFKPGFDTGPEPIVDTPGEKCVFILSGQIEHRFVDRVIVLQAGDSLYYPGDAPVSWRNIGNEICRSILIMTPPNF
jgi:transcriptional regulator with XRE-family HTH domain